MNSNRISELEELKNKQKFSDEEWENRGLNPSEKSLSTGLENYFNELIKDIIFALTKQNTEVKLKSLLENALNKISADKFDSEEREFIADYFEEISGILKLDFSEELNTWMYGITSDEYEQVLLAYSKRQEEKKVNLEIITKDCQNCNSKLETFILERDNNIPDFNFEIVKCVKCSELNILDNGPGIKRSRFLNYELVEELPKDEYDLEKALIRLKLIQD